MPKYTPFKVSDFSYGYDSAANPDLLPDGAMWRGSTDMALGSNGTLEKRSGYTKLISDASGPSWTTNVETIGIHQFYDPGNYRCLVRLARNTGTGATRVEFSKQAFPGTEATVWDTTGPSFGTVSNAEQWCDFASYRDGSGNGSLYIACPDLADVKYLTYSAGFTVNTVTDTGGYVDSPQGVELWYDRIWAFMAPSKDRGSFLVWTNLDGDDFEADNYQEIPGEGPITGMVRLGRNLIVFKPNETYILSGGDQPADRLQVNSLSRDHGCIAQRSIVVVENHVYWMAESGFFWSDGHNVRKVSDQIDGDFAEIYKTSIEKVHGVHHRDKNRVVWWVPLSNPTGDGYGVPGYGTEGYGDGDVGYRALAFDYDGLGAGSWCSPFTNQPFIVSCTYTNTTSASKEDADEIVVVAADDDSDYHLYRWWDGSDDDGTIFNAAFNSRPYDIGDTGMVKILRKVYLKVGEVGENTPIRFSASKGMTPVSVPGETSATRLTTLGELDDTRFVVTRHSIGLVCQQFQVTVSDYNDGTYDGGPFVLSEVTVLFGVKGRRDVL